MVFPLGKLFYLALKQVARPISKQLQSTAKNSQLMKNKILIPIGQREFIRCLLAISCPPLARPVKRVSVFYYLPTCDLPLHRYRHETLPDSLFPIEITICSNSISDLVAILFHLICDILLSFTSNMFLSSIIQ